MENDRRTDLIQYKYPIKKAITDNKTISCELDYCIYNSGRECVLHTISISAEGICNDCVFPDIDERALEKYKQETLARLKK